MTLYFNRQNLPDWQPTLSLLPPNEGVVVLMRHSVRPEIPEGRFGMQVDLTPEGVEAAEQLGAQFQGRLDYLASSSSGRCVQTGEAVSRGAQAALEVEHDPTLGEPGAFIDHVESSIQMLEAHGPLGLVNRLLQGLSLEGMFGCETGVQAILKRAFEAPPGPGRLHVRVTHDTLLCAVLAWLQEKTQVQEEEWPRMMEGALLWRKPGRLCWIWRGELFERELEDLWFS
jgi:hypothetical protein